MKDNYNDNPLAALQDIKKMMQASSRVLSLSGWSGIWAGMVALLGSVYFYYIYHFSNSRIDIYQKDHGGSFNDNNISFFSNYNLNHTEQSQLALTGIIVFILALLGAVYFTYRKNVKAGVHIGFNAIANKLLINLAIPMLAGGAFCLHFFMQESFYYLVPCSLVFYGLALINASKYTLTQIKYLGLFEIILGIIALFVMNYHIVIWAVGFGVLHIVYGILMWYKYDRK